MVRTRVGLIAILVALLASGGALVAFEPTPPARAATTLTWVGPDMGLWSEAANWDPAQAPEDGDTLVFGPLAASETTENDLGVLHLAELRVQSADNVTITGDGFDAALLRADDGTLAIRVPVDLSADLSVLTEMAGDVITIAAPGGLLDVNNRTVTVEAGSAGVFAVDAPFAGTGTVTVEGGVFEIDRPATFSGFLEAESGVLRYSFATAPPCGSTPAAHVTVGEEGELRVLCTAAIASLNASGRVSLSERLVDHEGDLSILGTGANVITGQLRYEAAGALRCCGTGGLLTISAAVFGDDGVAAVQRGTWDIVQSIFPATITFQVTEGGVLEGRGTAGAGLSFGATVSPGGAGATAILRSEEWLFATNSTYRADVIGTSFDRFVLNSGLVIEPHVTLDLHVTGTAPLGTVVTIARSGGAITGTFDDLPEGTRFTEGGQLWEISYEANDGRDITLTRVSDGPVPRARIPMIARD
ncbi:MAG: hypothetical protein IT303_15500 [Dehalococcoidia bacterium]|nr:hypothetical protein [Dehalococcoidia bacterium]